MKVSLDQLQHDIKYGRHSESVNLLSQSQHLAEKAPKDRPKLNDTDWDRANLVMSINFLSLLAHNKRKSG